ncbi:adenosylmethionine--8-amino-7-oxononanoate transaminase [Jatrophihabitans sp.]|uniref:adenosylmethionine--8-amino-7-oxononanoate transaminase n=1 Tax=Jatrophihabitans sp. TaxID=1932789 RepID=UPI0030C68EDF|nr:adenosylmethionine-8-amino-7-oxononanoateamino transferase [Jatrophihabitans sp.]
MSSSLISRDLASVWHPFTQHSLWPVDDPIVIDRASGVYLYDTDGRRYLDGVSSLWVTVHGHGEPEINEAIRAQLARLDHSTFLGLTHEPGIRTAEELLRVAPDGLAKVFFAGDGSSAAEAAIKIAYQAAVQRGEDRPLYLHIAEGYHGDTLGAVSLGGVELFHATYRPLLINTRMVSSPGVLAEGQTRSGRAFEVLAELRAVLEAEPGRVCAIVVEPLVQAAGGMLTHDPSFLVGVRALCDEFGASMLVDEVATGIGATGRWFAVEHAGVVPDLMVVGKRITGGTLPLSAVLATQEIYDCFLGEGTRTFFHGHTYTANPLSCAAALANLSLMHERGTVARAAAVGEALGAGLSAIERYDGVREIRRVGTMTGIEVNPVGERTGFEVCRAAREQGVIIRPLGDVVVLMPPLGISDTELAELVGVVDASIRKVVQ